MEVQLTPAALPEIRDLLAAVTLPIPLPSATSDRRRVARILQQLEDYLIPRIQHPEAPLLVVVMGATGSGKSTLINALLGRDVVATGVIRPTTKVSTLLVNPDDSHWFNGEPETLLVSQLSGDSAGRRGKIQVLQDRDLPAGLALLDTPDLDSVADSYTNLADDSWADDGVSGTNNAGSIRTNVAAAGSQGAGASVVSRIRLDGSSASASFDPRSNKEYCEIGDLWLFCTSAVRYADAAPWESLSQAARLSIPVAIVCNRVPPSAQEDVPAHLIGLLAECGLGNAPLFVVAESVVGAVSGASDRRPIPDAQIVPLRKWLEELVTDQKKRRELGVGNLRRLIQATGEDLDQVIRSLQSQVSASTRLSKLAEQAQIQTVSRLQKRAFDATLISGDVKTTWERFASSSQFRRAITGDNPKPQQRSSRRNRPKVAYGIAITAACRSALNSLVKEQLLRAAEQISINYAERLSVQVEPIAVDQLAEAAEHLITEWVTEAAQPVLHHRSAGRIYPMAEVDLQACLLVAVLCAKTESNVTDTVEATKVLTCVFGAESTSEMVSEMAESLSAHLALLAEKVLHPVVHRFSEVADLKPVISRLQELRSTLVSQDVGSLDAR